MIMTTILRSNSKGMPLWAVAYLCVGGTKEKEKNVWSFLRAECPIIENAKLPLYKQKQEYKLMFCKDAFSCPLYTEFQPKITKDI